MTPSEEAVLLFSDSKPSGSSFAHGKLINFCRTPGWKESTIVEKEVFLSLQIFQIDSEHLCIGLHHTFKKKEEKGEDLVYSAFL